MSASCNTCDTKNGKSNCPLKVPAGVAFTNYNGRCPANAELVGMLSQNGVINSSYEVRMFLQANGEKLMEFERTRALERLAPCAPCKRPFTEQSTMEPERYVVRCTPVSCERKEVNPNGIGDGRFFG
jgi:hypothetical protein